MNTPAHDPAARADELRRAFDLSFAAPRRSASAPADDLLLVRSHGRRYALRMPELHGLYPEHHVTPLPAPDPALLGIAGIRGQLVPAYSLAALLGGDDDHNPGTQRWLVVCQRPGLTVALAFDEFVGSTRVPESDIHPPPASQPLPPHVARVAWIPPEHCYVISTASILDTLAGRSKKPGPGESRDPTDAHATPQ